MPSFQQPSFYDVFADCTKIALDNMVQPDA